jgi:hypothetical protein
MNTCSYDKLKMETYVQTFWTSCCAVRMIEGWGPLPWGSALTKMGRFESCNRLLPPNPPCNLNGLCLFQLET